MSKVGARRDEQGAWLPALSPGELRAGVESNLRSLRIERLIGSMSRSSISAASTPVLGTTSVAHLEENLAAGDLALDGEDLATLDGVEQVGIPLTAGEA